MGGGAPEINPWLKSISPYQGGASKALGVDRVVKLSSNENPLGPSPRAVDAFRRSADRLATYPDGAAAELREAIGAAHGLDPDWIACGAGSDELISLLCAAYAAPGDETVHATHAFAMYRLSSLVVGAQPVAAQDDGVGADIEALSGAITNKTRLLFLANPNNPSGTLLTKAEIGALLDAVPESVMVALDAAYAEYVLGDGYDPGARFVEERPNVVMLRTFSKIYGLAALRVGWIYARPETIDALNRVRGPFNVSAPGLAAATAAVRDPSYINHCAVQNEVWRDWLTKRLNAAGVPTPDSHCNFVLPRFGREGPTATPAADAFLRARGLIARRLESYGMPDYLRITVGTPEDCLAVASAVSEFVDEAARAGAGK